MKHGIDDYKMEISCVVEGDDKFWIARYPDFNSCIGQGRTKIEAIEECEENLKALIAFFEENNRPLPVPSKDEDEYSGKFTVRISKQLHRRCAICAQENNVSLNHFVSEALAFYCANQQFKSSKTTIIEIIDSKREAFQRILYKPTRGEKYHGAN